MNALTKSDMFLGKKSRKQCNTCMFNSIELCDTIKIEKERLSEFRFAKFISKSEYDCPDHKKIK